MIPAEIRTKVDALVAGLEKILDSESALRPWRYPTPFDFHYGESLRARFDAGELEP